MNIKQQLKTATMEFMEKNEDVTVENDGKFQKIAKYSTGALFISPNGLYAVAIIDGKVKVGERPTAEDREKQDYPDGWKWTGVFGQGKVTVNEVFTGELYTDLVSILSEDGTLKIEGNLITMFDKNEVLRFQAGNNGDTYLFALYNAAGKRTAYMDDNGNLTICGIFKTGEEGEARTVIDGNGIRSYNEANQLHGLVSNPDGRHSDLALYYDSQEALKFYNAIDSYILYCYGNKIAKFTAGGNTFFENGADGVFTTPNNKRVTVRGGLITDISDVSIGE